MAEDIQTISMLQVGTILHGTYRIESYLSSGGFGNTYKAVHTQLNKYVAIKEFFLKGTSQRDADHTSVSISNPINQQQFDEQKKKFKKEAQRICMMDNPNIIKVHDLFEENGTVYYVMDFIDGESIAERLKRTGQPISRAEMDHILPQVLNALEETHAQEIWHLDLKPANIMIDRQGRAKLIDFGASKQLRPDGSGATTSTALCYTPGYAPNEQKDQDMRKFGPWTDFYALGATLYKSLTLDEPPSSSSIEEEGAKAFHFTGNVSNTMRDLIVWMMDIRRAKRPQSVSDIRRFLAERNETVAGNEADGTIIVETGKTGGIKGTDSSPSPTLSKNKALLFLLAGMLGGAIASFLIFQPKHRQPIAAETVVLNDTIPAFKNALLGECYYTGATENGVPHGEGTAKYKNGAVYTGSWNHGVMEGASGVFEDAIGKYAGSMKNNAYYYGQYTNIKDGSYFIGSFNNGKTNKGRWYDKNGKELN